MWKLEHLTNKTGVFLQHGGELTVSRQDGCWLQLSGDASISRKHALLRVTHSPQAVKRNVLSAVELKDVSAKNGTYFKREQDVGDVVEFIETDRLQTGATVILRNGDVVRFGLYNHCYRVVRCPLVVATSMLAAGDTEAVLADLLLLGATFSKDWTDQCTHLVMNFIKLSAKVSCALAYGAAIVTPAFLAAICSAAKSKESVLPPHQRYMPPITEPGIQPNPSLFERNVERRRVLSGRRFLFASQRTCKRLSSIVLSAGGSCGLLSSQDHTALAAGEALLVRGMEDGSLSASQGSPFTAALGVVQRARLNPVPESDIALAVLYCSTERFCNPALSQQSLVAPSVPQSQQESLVVFAPGTESFASSPLRICSTAPAPPTRSAAVTAPCTAAMVPDTPGSTASTASRQTRSSPEASTITCRSAKTAAVTDKNCTDESSRLRGGNKKQSVDVSVLRGGVSMDATPSLQLPSPSRPGDRREGGTGIEDSPRRGRLSRKRVLSSPLGAEGGAPVSKRPTIEAPIEPTQDIPITQKEDDRFFGDITSLDISQFVPKDASTQIMDVEGIPHEKSPERVNVSNTASTNARNGSNSTDREHAAGTAEHLRRTKAAVTVIPPSPTPPLSHPFPSSVSVPPTASLSPSNPSRNTVPLASPSRPASTASGHTSPFLSPDKATTEQQKQQQRRETITLSTLPSLPPETYADSSHYLGLTNDPPPTLDPPSLPDAAWLPSRRQPLAVVNDDSSARRNINRDGDVSGILDPPPNSTGVNSRADGPFKVERSDSRDISVFQMPTANVRRRKTKQTLTAPLPVPDSSTAVAMLPIGGIKRSRSTEEQEVLDQQAVVPTSRRIKCEPVLQSDSLVKESAVPPTHVASTQGFLSKPSRANGCNSTTVGFNQTSTAVAGASEPAAAASVCSNTSDDDNKDVKPNVELTRVSRAVLVSLVMRTSIMGEDYNPPSNDTTVNGKRNFKRFKKVTRFSGDRPCQAMPRIIGGKDLKPHTAFYAETDDDRRVVVRLQGLRTTWLSQHPDVSSYLDEQEQNRQERLREDMEDERDTGTVGGTGRGRGSSSMMSYLTTASTSASSGGRSAPGPSTHISGLPVFCMPVAKVRKRQRHT